MIFYLQLWLFHGPCKFFKDFVVRVSFRISTSTAMPTVAAPIPSSPSVARTKSQWLFSLFFIGFFVLFFSHVSTICSWFQYFNQCFAGCHGKTQITIKDDVYDYSDCSCVDGGSTTQSGICKFGKACIQHYFFIGTLAIMWTISNTNAKPLLNAIELSVEKANLTLAFGIYVFFVFLCNCWYPINFKWTEIFSLPCMKVEIILVWIQWRKS